MAVFTPEWESLRQYRIPDWFANAKFGIFIHWGVYSVPAAWSEWYPRNMYRQGGAVHRYHLETYGPDFGYKDFIPLFRAERFDPREWAALFHRAGARYVVPVAEHHDGFPMYATRLTRWNAADMGPRRDILAELGAAVRESGMQFGLSNHRAEHWWFMNGGRANPSDVQAPEYADFYGPAMPSPDDTTAAWDHNDWTPRPDAPFLENWLARNIELVDRFHPRLIYFDWWIHQLAFKPYLQQFAAYYYNHVPDGVITYKLDAFQPGTAVFDVERGYQTGIRPQPWQTCTSVSRNSWGYIQQHDYKEPAQLIHQLIDVVSKNGCLLLNVGPRADGSIPEPEQQILGAMGDWLNVNGEALFDSRPWRVFGEGPTRVPEGQFNDNDIHFCSRDIRFTRKDARLFAFVLGRPEETIEIKSLALPRDGGAERVRAIRLLGFDGPLAWKQDATGLTVQAPPADICSPALVFEITLD